MLCLISLHHISQLPAIHTAKQIKYRIISCTNNHKKDFIAIHESIEKNRSGKISLAPDTMQEMDVKVNSPLTVSQALGMLPIQ